MKRIEKIIKKLSELSKELEAQWEADRKAAGVITAHEAQELKNKPPVEIELTTVQTSHNGLFFSWANPWKGNGGEVQTGYFAKREDAIKECIRMAEAVWGNVIVTEAE